MPLTSLTELKLDRTDISDKSLGWLTAQKNLHYADLYHTLITEQGHQTLVKAFPKCDINWSVDSTRLLLNSKSARHPNGLGNGSDVIGRYLCEQMRSGAEAVQSKVRTAA